MKTTTIRIDTDTHSRLLEMSRVSGKTLIETVRDAAEALRRRSFAARVGEEIASLRSDTVAWTAYLTEADETSVSDGIG